MDLRELLQHLKVYKALALGGSLGCSILWCYAELFTTNYFTRMIFVDQSPLQNSTLDGWDSRYCNRGMNSAPAVAAMQMALSLAPDTVYSGTTAICLAYRSHPRDSDEVTHAMRDEDEAFFLGEARRGDAEWFGKLMADHTALDWRDSIRSTFGPGSGSFTKVLVIASTRSGCFPAAGPMTVVDFVNGETEEDSKKLAQGVVIDWGGHWCYWENPESFNKLVLDFLDKP
ncbi:alpha/beta-hydrolase [Microthyrium microscopicum]|uniref:Alpha/beta-hydrolase n=1 Tax=Microthyrium microscopicum TaxID=703497 RepID=A0A6A6U0B2_9PEZI|nr:alpha/beta-hydrolase [Microthyrium microscopicum]